MKPEHDRLIREIFEDGGNAAGRNETLTRGGRLLWRRRLVRRSRIALLVGAIFLLSAALVWRSSIGSNQGGLASRAIPRRAPPEKVKELTDEDLLALFPNTPVALAEVGGKKRLFFPRPADEARYITRVAGNWPPGTGQIGSKMEDVGVAPHGLARLRLDWGGGDAIR